MTYREPTIDEALADPMIRKMMAADRQAPRDVAVLLRGASQRVRLSAAGTGLRPRGTAATSRECCLFG